jgi:hypothetical protein
VERLEISQDEGRGIKQQRTEWWSPLWKEAGEKGATGATGAL